MGELIRRGECKLLTGPVRNYKLGTSSRNVQTALIAEIQILQRLRDLEAAHELDRSLQIVALLAGDAQFVALDRGLHLEFRILDRAHDALGGFGADALF